MARSVEMTYGNALFLAAGTEERLKALLPETEKVRRLYNGNPEAFRFVFMPELSESEKLEQLLSVFPETLPREIAGLYSVLLEKHRFDTLPGVLKYFADQAKEALGIGDVSVRTARPLTDEQKKKLEEKILSATSFRSVDVKYLVEESLIGGMRIRIGDHILDTSISTKLGALTDALKKS